MQTNFRSSFSTIVAGTFNARLRTLSAKIRVESAYPGDFICGTLIIKNSNILQIACAYKVLVAQKPETGFVDKQKQ